MAPRYVVPARPGPYTLASPGTVEEASAESTVPERKPHFRPDIEGLRAVAVIAVLLFHVGIPAAGGGFTGVDIFYVISGFLITSLLLREGERTGKVDLVAFYARRMRRLLPAALLVIVVTLAASAVVLSPLRLTEVAGDAAAAALYVSNFRFAIEATDYLAVAAPSPLLHYWSLGRGGAVLPPVAAHPAGRRAPPDPALHGLGSCWSSRSPPSGCRSTGRTPCRRGRSSRP